MAEMAVNCSNQFPTTDVLYKEISGDPLIVALLTVGCVLAAITVILHVETVLYMRRVGYTRHQTHYAQRCLLLGVYPVICVMSIISLLVPTSTTLNDLIVSCYLSWCIYTFVHMTVDYFGGESGMIEVMFQHKVRLTTPPCCCFFPCCLKPITLTRRSLRMLKFFSMQVIFVRPLVLFIGAVLWTDGKYEQKMAFDSSYLYIAAISGISTLLSMYGLIVVFRASYGHLRGNGYIVKFVVLQVAVILANMQSSIFNFLAQRNIPGCNGTRGPRVRDASINHAILVIESFLLCLLARYGYRREEPHLETLAKHNTWARAARENHVVQTAAGEGKKSDYTRMEGSVKQDAV